MEENFDIKQLENDVAKVLCYSQNFCADPTYLRGVPQILQRWADSKKFFIDRMGGNLIYQLPELVSFELDDRAKMEKLERFAQMVEEHYDNSALARFLYDVGLQDFYNNRTSCEYSIEDFNGESIKVPKNFKVVKAFKFFEPNIDRLKDLQNEASRIIQENVISGHLCVSVHPLDYLSLSENVHNWRSCHALDGEYRSGNLNYMVDPTTVVCYLRAEKQAVLPHFPEDVLWNSKKWRVLLFFSNDKTMVFAGRPYPFCADHGIEIIREKILPILTQGSWTPWYSSTISLYQDEKTGQYFTFSKMIPVGNELQRFDRVVQDGDDTYQFNDLIRSSVYSPIWSYRRRTSYWETDGTGCSDNHTHVTVGRNCPCPICGSGTISYTDMMLCPSCSGDYGYDDSDYYECEICGSMTYVDDLYDLEYSELRVCHSCYERETVGCQECGIRDMPDTVKYREGDSRCLCPACWEEAQRRQHRPVRIEDIQIHF